MIQMSKKKGRGQSRFPLWRRFYPAVHTVLKGLGITRLEMSDIIYSGIAIAAIFMPVYFSIFLDKIRDIKFGGR